MRCPICDADNDSVTFTEPCGACQTVIQDCVSSYPQKEEQDLIVEEGFDVGC